MPKLEKIIGLHSVEAALKNDPERVDQVIYHRGRHDQRLQKILQLAQDAGVPAEVLDDKLLDKKSGSRHHQGVMALYRAAAVLNENSLAALLEKIEGVAFLLVLDGVTDPHNLGACLRLSLIHI